MHVCVYSVCAVQCVARGFATGLSPLPTVYRINKPRNAAFNAGTETPSVGTKVWIYADNARKEAAARFAVEFSTGITLVQHNSYSCLNRSASSAKKTKQKINNERNPENQEQATFQTETIWSGDTLHFAPVFPSSKMKSASSFSCRSVLETHASQARQRSCRHPRGLLVKLQPNSWLSFFCWLRSMQNADTVA
jgi:hypothetical protein